MANPCTGPSPIGCIVGMLGMAMMEIHSTLLVSMLAGTSLWPEAQRPATALIIPSSSFCPHLLCISMQVMLMIWSYICNPARWDMGTMPMPLPHSMAHMPLNIPIPMVAVSHLPINMPTFMTRCHPMLGWVQALEKVQTILQGPLWPVQKSYQIHLSCQLVILQTPGANEWLLSCMSPFSLLILISTRSLPQRWPLVSTYTREQWMLLMISLLFCCYSYSHATASTAVASSSLLFIATYDVLKADPLHILPLWTEYYELVWSALHDILILPRASPDGVWRAESDAE